jgi:hypothetical protein
MKLQELVCTEEQAIELKKLGVSQDGAYCYYMKEFLFGHPDETTIVLKSLMAFHKFKDMVAAAFTTDELMAELGKVNAPLVIYPKSHPTYAQSVADALIKALRNNQSIILGDHVNG